MTVAVTPPFAVAAASDEQIGFRASDLAARMRARQPSVEIGRRAARRILEGFAETGCVVELEDGRWIVTAYGVELSEGLAGWWR